MRITMTPSDKKGNPKGQKPKRPAVGGWKYLAVATDLEAAILAGRYPVGAQLPSERTLVAEHGVTLMTVRGAMQVLADKGLISREQGRGTFVTMPSPPGGVAGAVIRKPIGLIGLSPALHPTDNAINWQSRLRRLQGIVDAAFQLGLPVQTQVDANGDRPLAARVGGLERFAGLILHEESLPEAALLALHERGVPTVAINCYLTAGYCSRIHVNGRLGASRAVGHLIDLGHRRIACLVGDPARPSMGERLQGYRVALEARGIPFDDALLVIEPRGWPSDAADATARLLALPERPTAIFAASDYRALGVLEQLHRSGVAVPGEMAVVGFDDICEAETSVPPLTTVANPLYESGREAVRMLNEQIAQGKASVELRVMECGLKVRESSGAVTGKSAPHPPQAARSTARKIKS